MRRADFEALVTRAIAELPAEFQRRLDNIDLVVQDWPIRRQLASTRTPSRFGLLGLYEGVPQTTRGSSYGLVTPDKITIFRRPIEATCSSPREMEQRVREVVQHEIAHHFGISDRRLRTLRGEE